MFEGLKGLWEDQWEALWCLLEGEEEEEEPPPRIRVRWSRDDPECPLGFSAWTHVKRISENTSILRCMSRSSIN